MMLTQTEGLLLIAGFFLLMQSLFLFFKKRQQTKEEYLVAGRKAPWILTAFSMAATWVWAPALFTASEKAYL